MRNYRTAYPFWLNRSFSGMLTSGVVRGVIVFLLSFAGSTQQADAIIWVFHDADPDYQMPPFDDTLTAMTEGGRPYITQGGFNISQSIGANRVITSARDGSSILVCENVADRMSKIGAAGDIVFSIARPINAVDVTSDGTIFGLEDHRGTIFGENILRISAAGQVLQQAAYGGFDLAVDENHHGIYVVGADIKYLNLDLQLMWTNDPIPWCAVSVDIASDGSAWVAEREHSQVLGSANRLRRISPQGTLLQTINLAYSPFCVRVDRTDDSFYVSSDRLYKYDRQGVLLFAALLGRGWGMALNAAREIWVGTYADIRKFSPNGTLLLTTNRFSYGSVTYVATVPIPEPALFIRASTVGASDPALSKVSEVELSWPTVPNLTYVLEYRSSLTTNQWNQLQSTNGNANPIRVYDKIAAEEPQRFYRVVVRE